jgi:hypothetical protein
MFGVFLPFPFSHLLLCVWQKEGDVNSATVVQLRAYANAFFLLLDADCSVRATTYDDCRLFANLQAHGVLLLLLVVLLVVVLLVLLLLLLLLLFDAKFPATPFDRSVFLLLCRLLGRETLCSAHASQHSFVASSLCVHVGPCGSFMQH